MLEPWIIEQIRRREEEERRRYERPQLEMPVPDEPYPAWNDSEAVPAVGPNETERGVVIISF